MDKWSFKKGQNTNDCVQGDIDIRKLVKMFGYVQRRHLEAPMRRVDHIVSQGTHYYSCLYYML